MEIWIFKLNTIHFSPLVNIGTYSYIIASLIVLWIDGFLLTLDKHNQARSSSVSMNEIQFNSQTHLLSKLASSSTSSLAAASKRQGGVSCVCSSFYLDFYLSFPLLHD